MNIYVTTRCERLEKAHFSHIYKWKILRCMGAIEIKWYEREISLLCTLQKKKQQKSNGSGLIVRTMKWKEITFRLNWNCHQFFGRWQHCLINNNAICQHKYRWENNNILVCKAIFRAITFRFSFIARQFTCFIHADRPRNYTLHILTPPKQRYKNEKNKNKSRTRNDSGYCQLLASPPSFSNIDFCLCLCVRAVVAS